MSRPSRWSIRIVLGLWWIVTGSLSLQAQLLSGWSFRQVDGGEWMPAEIPGCVHTNLLRNGRIPDPFIGNKEQVLRWIESVPWEFKAALQVPFDPKMRWQYFLELAWVDTYADIYVNGKLALQTDNMFRRYEINLTPYLTGEKDSILVRFHPPSIYTAKNAAARGYKLPADNDTDSLSQNVYTRKPAYHFGWDWGPRFVTMGIHQAPSIRMQQSICMKDFSVSTLRLSEGKAEMKAEVTIQSDIEGEQMFRLTADGGPVKSGQVALKRGTHPYSWTFDLPDPELWWPNGMGAQRLYEVGLSVISVNGILDEAYVKTGIREIRLIQAEDQTGKAFSFTVNGKPLFVKGTNYIPSDNFLSRAQGKSLQALRDAQAVGMNMVRVWGGGTFETDAFYTLCDSLGILVWQDLMFAGGMYPLDDAYFTKNVQAEIQDQLSRLRKHASIALICGNNEIEVAWKNWGWQQKYGIHGADSTKLWDSYVQAFQGWIPELVGEILPNTAYISTSPLSNWGTPAFYNSGNMHDWKVWHGNAPIDSLRGMAARFVTEYGFQSYPLLGSLLPFGQAADFEWGSAWMQHRQKSYKGNAPILNEIERLYGKPKDFEAFAILSQFVQAQALTNAIETHRMAAPHCMGTMYWQLNDCWPGPSWSTIDYTGQWKAGHFALKRLYAPTLISITEETGNLLVRGLSEVDADPVLNIRLCNLDGRIVKTKSKEIHLSGLLPVSLLKEPLTQWLKGVDPRKVYLLADLTYPDGVTFSATHFFVPPKDLALAAPAFKINVEGVDGQYWLSVKSETLIKDACFTLKEGEGTFSQNFFDILPGQTYTIDLRTDPSLTIDQVLKQVRLFSLADLTLR